MSKSIASSEPARSSPPAWWRTSTCRIGQMEEDQPADRGVEWTLVAIVADIALDEANVLEAGLGRPFLRHREQPGLGVDTDDLASRSDEVSPAAA